MDNKLIKVLILIILYKLPKRSNAYDLSRILEWKFQCFDYKNILKELERDNYIKINLKPVNEYSLEPIGREYIEKNIDDLKNKVFSEFPLESEFLTVLLS